MKNRKIGFIGSGKMAGAIIAGLLKSGFVASEKILATQSKKEGLEEKKKTLGIDVISDNKILAQEADVIIISVKPFQVQSVLEEISETLKNKLVVSIAAGVTTQKIESILPEGTRVVRVMPNTPLLLGAGMSAIIGGNGAEENDIEYVNSLFSSIGKCIVLDNESQMDIVTAISGSGPAFYYKVINDIALAGEKLGLDYEKALLLSVQTALGAAKMILNRNVDMNELISNVATKGGCTRVGVDVMEEINTEQIFYKVIEQTAQKASQLG